MYNTQIRQQNSYSFESPITLNTLKQATAGQQSTGEGNNLVRATLRYGPPG